MKPLFGEAGDASIFALFRAEAESTITILSEGVLALEQSPPGASGRLEGLMRAAHSLKGAARIVGVQAAVRIAHVLEDIFVSAQAGKTTIGREHADHLLAAIDLLDQIARTPEPETPKWDSEQSPLVDRVIANLRLLSKESAAAEISLPPSRQAIAEPQEDGFVRVSTETLNRLFALVSETQVEARWLPSFGTRIARLRRLHREIATSMIALRTRWSSAQFSEANDHLSAIQTRLDNCSHVMQQRLAELENFESRLTNLAERLQREAVVIRMRPLADGLAGFPRMVRDVARHLGKEVRFEIEGAATQVDREVLDRLETLIGHLLRNAVDHGIESSADRRAAGKSLAGLIRLQAYHRAGRLNLVVTDDGSGVDAERIRATVVERRLADATTAARLDRDELFEFLFLPGFSLKSHVTEISGRGVGLDAVQTMVSSLRGSIRVSSIQGQGTRFDLQLPLTLSVTRSLIVEIAAEIYAIPLAQIVGSAFVAAETVCTSEGRQHFSSEGQSVGLVSGHQLLGRPGTPRVHARLPVVILQTPHQRYGLSVDRFVGERELVVQPLDPRLGKIPDIAAGAILEDGSPLLIFDVEDLIRSIEKLARDQPLNPIAAGKDMTDGPARKRILVADDSLTVRELQRKLLESQGYEVEVAVDGMQAWNTVRARAFDLVISDVDMPRIDGIKLTRLIKADARLRTLPVVIVSYKDRDEDRILGLEAGADHYLTKASFQNDTLAATVDLLLGEFRPSAPS